MRKVLAFMLLAIFVLSCLGQDIEISVATTDQVNPAIASDGTDFVVAWEDNRAGSSNKNIMGHPIFGDGDVPMTFFAVSTSPGNQTEPAMSAIDDTYFMVWSEPGGDISYRRSSFTVLEDGPSELVSTSEQTSNLNITAGDGIYFVVWEENSAIKGLPVRADGTALSSTVDIHRTPDTQTYPDVAYFDGSFYVVWAQEGTENGIFGKAFNASGTAVGDFEVIDNTSDSPSFPSIASNGFSALVVYHVQNDGARDIMGKVLSGGDAEPFSISSASGHQQRPVVEIGTGAFLVVYEDYGDGYFANIMGRWVSPSGSPVGDIFVISSEDAAQGNPRIAFAEETFLVAWDDRRGGGADIYGKIIESEALPGGPVANIISPRPNKYVACDEIEVRIHLSDPDGIDESTISLNIGSDVFTLDSPLLSLVDDTLILSESSLGADGETIDCSISGVEDMLGNVMAGSLEWSFHIDRSAPSFVSPTPPDESTQPMLPAMITVNISDEGSGVDPNSLHIEAREVDLSYPDPALLWNDVTFALITDSVDVSREYYVNDVCVIAADMPDYCEANIDTFCWRFYNLNDVKEYKPVEYAMDAAYPNPFNSAVTIEIPIRVNYPAILRIYNIEGNLIEQLESDDASFIWRPDIDIKSGVYNYTIQTVDVTRSGKVLYIK
ncbi:MAG: T9SS type A sorting domain-containing protein [Candidatus Zixiibacteriota bacterium]